MSNRDSLGFGELIPQDVVDIFAQEKHSTRSRKKRSHSLGRALGWLKGKKRKDLVTKKQSLGLGTALDLAFDGHPAGQQGGHKGGQKSGRQTPQAVQKRSDDDDDRSPAAPLFQENVFIEASRPKYLENLHTEALEGLKMMQQEETSNGVEYRDNESTISNMAVHTDGEGGFMTDSTIADSTSVVSVKSSVSTRSSRSGLTRQESTFRPLNSGKKSKTRRKQRKTVAGIPQHVQRELGLDRVGWTLAQTMNENQVYDGETDESPTTPGLQQAAQTGASIPIHPLNKEQLDQLAASHTAHGDDLSMLHRLDPNSLHSELSSPVITTSPQAAYMSKIIPNAVLPPSIDVVEISRGRSRNSVRTVSKSSLVMSSPATSRASSRASSVRTTSSKASTITSASQQNPPNMTDSSCWSNSESSETLVSDSSTISSSSTPRQKRSQDGNASAKEDKISVHSSISKASKGTSNGRVISKGKEGSKDGQFVRSLSVMKSKRAPPPPNRSYSLHNKMKRRSRDLAEVRVIPVPVVENEKNKPGPSPVPSKPIDSPGYNADTSSLDESAGSASFILIRSQLNTSKEAESAKVAETDSKDAPKEQSKIVSPSSGYSSHDGTSTQSMKESHSSSPRHKRGLLAKLQRLFPGSSSSASPPPPASRPETPGSTKLTQDTTVDATSPSVRALRELFNIPPHPKVHAPPPPPPEVWVHSQRSIELLLGPPVPDNVYAIIKKNPKDRRPHRQSPSASTEGSVKVERKHKTETKKVLESVILNADVHKENSDRLATQRVDLKVTEKDEKVRASDILSGLLVKAVVNREERLAAREEEAKRSSTQTPEGKSKTDTSIHIPPSSKKTTEVVSPESSWPPPPPPIGQIVITDEMDFPLPPPPMFGGGLVLPVQVPPESSSHDEGSTSSNPPLNIPPPPSYSAPPPPVGPVTPSTLRRLSPLPPIQEVPVSPPPSLVSPPLPPTPPVEVSLPPQSKDVSSSPPLKETIPPPPPLEVSPPPKDVTPPLPKELVLPPLPVEVPPLPPEVTPLQPPKKVTPPPPPKEVILPSPPIEVSPPPPKEDILLSPPTEVSPPPPKEVILPSPPIEVSPPPPKEVILLSPPTEVSPPPPPEEVILLPPPVMAIPPPTEVTPLPPPKEVTLPPPPIEVSPPFNEITCPPPQPEEVSPPSPPIDYVSTTLDTVISPPSSQEALPPPVLCTDVSPLPPTEASSLSSVEVSPPSSDSLEVTPPVGALRPPQSIPPPPPLPTQPQQENDPPQEKVPSEPEPSISILVPPESIPPPPPIQHQSGEDNTGSLAQETSPPPESEASIPPAPEKAEPSAPANIPLPPPLPSAEPQPSPSSTEKQTPEQTSTPVVKEEPSPIITPSLLQMVKLRSVNSSPEPPKAPEQPEEEVTMRKQVTTTSTSSEAPQKPIRRSLIMISPSSPTSTSPPAAVTSQATLPKTQSLVIPITSSTAVLSPTKKSPPAMTPSPSMNLQEAIRLRTAARSKENPPSRLSLHSPTSPIDVHKSPSSTASFIFSKSNKRVVIETRPVMEKTSLDVSSVTKVESEAESGKKGVKVPPPVAKKPKTKGKETEASERTEQTAGQEDSNKDGAEKTNGTAGTVE